MTLLSRTRSLVAGAALGCLALVGCSSSDTPAPTSSSSGSSSPTSSASGSSPSTAGESPATESVSSAPYTGVNTSADSTEPDANTGAAAAPTTTAPAATTEVPPPGSAGNINETVPSVSLSTNTPVSLTATGEYGNGVTVSLTGIESVTTQAELPGEISGPGVKLTVQISNGSSQAIDVGNVVVDLQDAAGVPAISMSASPASPFTGTIAAGASATGAYVYSVPSDYANPATIYVSYSTEVPVAVFVGDAK